MSVPVFRNFAGRPPGWVLGLGPFQLALLAAGSLPVWAALGGGRWTAAGMFLLLWLLTAALVSVPVAGRSVFGWVWAAAGFSIATITGWGTFTSRAETGRLRDLADPDLPGVLRPLQIIEGPASGQGQERIAIIKNPAARTWTITAQFGHEGLQLADADRWWRAAAGLGELLDAACQAELVSQVHLLVRATPDDAAEREGWLRQHLAPDAPATSVATNIELLRWARAGTRYDYYLSLVVPDARLAKQARRAGGRLQGRLQALAGLAAEFGPALAHTIGARDVAWLTSPQLAAVVRTGFAPDDYAGLVHAAAEHTSRPEVVADVPWALAGPSHASPAVRYWRHDAWCSVSATLKLPDKGAPMGALPQVLDCTDPQERRSLLVVFPIDDQIGADRKASRQEFTASLGQGLRDRFGIRTSTRDLNHQTHLDRIEANLARGATLIHPYAVACTTIPTTCPIGEYGRRLDASIRRAGFAPQRLDMAQDVGFAAATLPLGISLGTGRSRP